MSEIQKLAAWARIAAKVLATDEKVEALRAMLEPMLKDPKDTPDNARQ